MLQFQAISREALRGFRSARAVLLPFDAEKASIPLIVLRFRPYGHERGRARHDQTPPNMRRPEGVPEMAL